MQHYAPHRANGKKYNKCKILHIKSVLKEHSTSLLQPLTPLGTEHIPDVRYSHILVKDVRLAQEEARVPLVIVALLRRLLIKADIIICLINW